MFYGFEVFYGVLISYGQCILPNSTGHQLTIDLLRIGNAQIAYTRSLATRSELASVPYLFHQ